MGTAEGREVAVASLTDPSLISNLNPPPGPAIDRQHYHPSDEGQAGELGVLPPLYTL